MCLMEDKENQYKALLLGEEVKIENLVDAFSSCWIVSRAVKVNEDTIGLFDLGKTALPYQALVLSKSHAPTVTTKSTNELMKNFRNEDKHYFEMVKEIVETMVKHEIYCFPDIYPEMLMIPLEGSSCKEANYVNFTMLADVDKYSDYQTILSFYNYLEIVIDRPYATINDKFFRCFKYHSLFCYYNNQSQRKKEGFDYLTDWSGDYHKVIKGFLSEVKYFISVDDFRHIKEYAFIKHARLSDEKLYTLLDS